MLTAKLLIVDDDVDVLSAAKLLLKRHFSQVDIEKNPQRIPFLVTNGNYDAILLDMNFTRDVISGKEGFDWLDRILDTDPLAVVVLFTAFGDVEMAVRAMKAGAMDFVLKPWENDKLLATMQAAVHKRADNKAKAGINPPAQANKPAAGRSLPQANFVASSAVMQQLYATAERVAVTDATVLVLGENGTGKSDLAQLIHQKSNRADKPFVIVDLGAIPESLFESELFGHVKGAFTDAKEDRAGRFEEAHGGTLFLDEIGNLSLPMQAKLLTVLQNRTVTRVGSNKTKQIDVRIICATNQPIGQMVADRTFRQDLLYRINTIELRIPPLRERPEDIVPLTELFLKQYRHQYKRVVTTLSAALVKQLQRYHWPGNVRELRSAVERAVILAQQNTLQPEDFFQNAFTETSQFTETYQLEEMEKQLIVKAMKKYNGNITEVAKELGLSRQALYRRMEKYGL
ncbi:sigma-54-dependent transcriptional regulator [Runella slithyformis]|uniref:Two component, sigma54 specific, transcriptional regulator, Fis family n=1 Tax=Runella slithyformis (strain ATCC 29530 / DSM 19594 / LMG 11500 / NCIMB 11436 / LSU 4) TaxID=761193 RepID=A0A7U3ZJJ3_RUNSL|nr:sigma-54 dependent transcriptional regulator [Runella slithyformis]AEI48394.1 two component, sigma54 specific, transcriptional regulator, Fis family [Runella slithyformis DSM 19594]